MYIIIHSKYFSISDWVKHVTSYYVLLTTFGWILQYVLMTSTEQHNRQKTEQLTEKT